MRVFAACRLDHHTAAELDRALISLRAGYSGRRFRWVPAQNYHLTLRFFGDVSSEAAAEIGGLMEPVARRESPIECRAGTPVPLPNARRPNVVALPIESNGRLERLADECNAAFALRFGGPDKPFMAHLTVLRCRPGARFRAVAAAIEVPFTISRVGLYESTQVAGATRYTALSEFELGRAGAA
jgi:2'-5' RNA ligase